MLCCIEKSLVLSVCLAFLAGACKLNYIAPMYLIIMIITAYRYRSNKKYYLWLNTAFLAGAIVYLAAPGNYNRLKSYKEHVSILIDLPNFIHAMKMYLIDLKDVRNYLVLLPFIVLGMKYSNQIDKQLLAKFAKYIVLLLIASLVINYFTFYLVSSGGFYGFRVWNLVYLIYLLLITIVYLATGAFIGADTKVFTLATFVTVFILLFLGYRTTSSLDTLIPLYSNYANAEDKRVNLILEHKENHYKGVLCLERLPNCPVLPGNDISADTSYWQNQDIVNRFDGNFYIKQCE